MRPRVYRAIDRELFWFIAVIVGAWTLVTAGFCVLAAGTSAFFSLVALVVTVILIWVLIATAVILRAKTLTVTAEGFELAGITTSWADVAGFDVDVDRGVIEVRYAPTAPRTIRRQVSGALRCAYVIVSPTYIRETQFDAGGHPLVDVLRDGWRRYHDPDDDIPTELDDALREPTDSPARMIIPLRRRRAAWAVAACGATIVALTVAAVSSVLVRAPQDGSLGQLILGIVWIVFWLSFLAPMTALFISLLRRLRSGGIQLDGEGFQAGKYRWAWADLESIEPGINVVYRRDCIDISAPSQTGINPKSYGAGGESVLEILREWQHLYR